MQFSAFPSITVFWGWAFYRWYSWYILAPADGLSWRSDSNINATSRWKFLKGKSSLKERPLQCSLVYYQKVVFFHWHEPDIQRIALQQLSQVHLARERDILAQLCVSFHRIRHCSSWLHRSQASESFRDIQNDNHKRRYFVLLQSRFFPNLKK